MEVLGMKNVKKVIADQCRYGPAVKKQGRRRVCPQDNRLYDQFPVHSIAIAKEMPKQR